MTAKRTQRDIDKKQSAKSRRPWGRRILVAVILGVVIGAVAGVMGVQTLEPGRRGEPDSLQVLLDSVANSRVSSPRDSVVPPVASIDTAAGADIVAAEGTVAVPNLADVEEGDARVILEQLGFDVGQVVFRGSAKPLGTVLSTFPVAGERVALPVTVNLVLSDGRGQRDSVGVFPAATP